MKDSLLPSDGGPNDDEPREDAGAFPPGPPCPGAGGPDGQGPGEDDFRRQMVEDVLVSPQLFQAIELIVLRFRRRGFRGNDVLDMTNDVLGEVSGLALERWRAFDPRRGRPLAWVMGFAVNVLRERRRWYAREARHRVCQSSCSVEKW